MPAVKHMVYAALFVALTACGAFIAIPIGPVPIVLQNMFVLLAGLILGPSWGLAAIALYLLIGLAGLPVFAGGTAGLGKLFGPTGGYLISYLPAVWVTGFVSDRFRHTRMGDTAAAIAGSIIIYAIGVPWLKIAFSLSWTKALTAGMLPFLPGCALKIAVAVFLASRLRKRMNLNTGGYSRL